MKPTPHPITLRAPGAKRILAAYDDAQAKSETAVQAALICGQLLREQRAALSSCHDGKSSLQGHNQHSGGDNFNAWLAEECPKISERTAYRWIKAAERTDTVLQLSDAIDIETVSLSEVLTSGGHAARQLWLDFTADKTLADCLRDVVEGESPDHRIARAYNGKNAAGAGGSGDRKEFEKFAALKIKHLTTFVRAKLTVNQKSLIVAALHTALELWPRWLLEALANKCRSELKLSDQDRASRKDF